MYIFYYLNSYLTEKLVSETECGKPMFKLRFNLAQMLNSNF